MKRALTLLLLCVSPAARATVDPPMPATCTVKGKLRKRVEVYSAATAGTQLLTTHFMYDRNYEIYEFPGDTKTGRVHARSSRDVPGLRIDGFIAAEDFLFTAAKDQPVIVDHVWLAAGASLRLFATKNGLEADAIGSPFANTRTHAQECANRTRCQGKYRRLQEQDGEAVRRGGRQAGVHAQAPRRAEQLANHLHPDPGRLSEN
jgi:hypothetical protein